MGAEILCSELESGRLRWIGLRPGPHAAMNVVSMAKAITARGLEGDRTSKKPGGRRQITLVQAEHLPLIAASCGRQSLPPELLRRNLVVSGIDLLSLIGRCFSIGAVLLEGNGSCAPCDRLESALGSGAHAAMAGRGGITARIIEGGMLRLGDGVSIVERQAVLPLVRKGREST